MNTKKKSTIVWGSILLVILLVSCGKNNSRQDYTTLNYGSTKDIRDINPHLYTGEMSAQNMVFEGLTKNINGEVKPCLAKSWTVSDDGTEYIFTLRENVVFSDGETFDANAVKQNFDAILANKERHAWLDMVNEIDKTEVIDEHTFKLTLRHPYYPTLVELGLTRPFRFISPKCFKNGGTKDGVVNYAGTGPYKLTQHKDDQSAIFEVNEHYWGNSPKMAKITWRVISDSQSLLLALKKKEIDLIYGADGDQLNMDTYNSLSKDKNFTALSSEPVASRAILLNSKRANLKSLDVREAIAHAINKDNIIKGILNGTEELADTLLPKSAPYCDINLDRFEYNPDEANQILDQAGWAIGDDGVRYQNGQSLELTFSYNAQNAQEGTIAETIQADLKEIGIKLTILSEEKQMFLERQKDGDFDLQYSLSWGTPYDPQSYVSSWRIPAHGDYQAQLGLDKKEWLDNLITEVMIESDESKRQQDYKDILSYINDECIYVPISYSKTKAISVSDLKNIQFNDSQYEIPFEKMYFEEN